jgi:hypothetical protein
MNAQGLSKNLIAGGVLWALLASIAAPAPAQDLTKLGRDLSAKIHAAKHNRVTVVDFLDLDKKTTKLGKLLAFKLQAALTEPERHLEVVDQSQFAMLSDQMEKLSEGLIDPATGQQLGKMAGTEVLIVGTVMVSENSVKLDVKAIDLQTAKMIAAGSTSAMRVGIIDRLAKEAEKAEPESVSAASGEESTAPATMKSSAGKAAHAPPRTKRDQGILFAIDGCSLSGEALTCSVTVTSDRDRWLAVSFGSRAWNRAGEEYAPGEIMIANSRNRGNCASKQILKNVSTQLTLTFPQFGEEDAVERIRLLWREDDDCWDYDARPVDFEKVVVSEDADFTSPQTAGHKGGSKGDSAAPAGKGGGLFRRVTGKLIDTLADTAEKVIDKKAKKVTGDDEEEDDSKKPPHR